jgi:trehalose synthase
MNELPLITVGRHCCSESIDIDNYRPLTGDALIDEIHALAEGLRGLRVCEINATASGGGVAELLSRELPVYTALGIQADWRIIHGDKAFFTVTKQFHNAMQGALVRLTEDMEEEYRKHNRTSAELLGDHYDVYMVHDPQPAALRYFHEATKAKWIWRCHIDTSAPNPDVWQFLRP